MGSNKLYLMAPMLLEELKNAAAQFRVYEALHRAKGTKDSLKKAEVNNELATRFEGVIRQAGGVPHGA